VAIREFWGEIWSDAKQSIKCAKPYGKYNRCVRHQKKIIYGIIPSYSNIFQDLLKLDFNLGVNYLDNPEARPFGVNPERLDLSLIQFIF